MVRTAAAYDDGPIAFRYPRGNGVGVDMPERGSILEIGKGRIVREGTKVALLSFGTRLQDCLLAAEELGAAGLSTTVADARFAKPLDEDLIRRLARSHEVLVTVEEGAVGGFASHVLQFLAHEGLLESGLKVRPLVLPDAFTDHAKPEKMYADAGLDAGRHRAHRVRCPGAYSARPTRLNQNLKSLNHFAGNDRNALFTLPFGVLLTVSLGRFSTAPC